jgi:hypothetical protein
LLIWINFFVCEEQLFIIFLDKYSLCSYIGPEFPMRSKFNKSSRPVMKFRFVNYAMGVLFFIVPQASRAQSFAGGSGTAGDPYQVNTPAHLNDVRNYLTSYFIQTGNIDLNVSPYNTGSGWNPIAGGGTADLFTGQYDGNGYTISNLMINRSSTANVGLFGHLGEGTVDNPVVIQDVHLSNVNVVGARGTGSLVGRVTGNIYTLIENCDASGSAGKCNVTGDAATGGLVGSNNSVTQTPGGTNNPIISKCWANIDVVYSGADPGVLNAEKYGGLAGCNQKGTILDSYALGSVTANKSDSWDVSNVGGLAGCILYRGRIERSYSTGAVSGTNATNLGGLLGNRGTGGNAGVIEFSYWDTQTSGQSSSAGGTGMTTAEMKVEANFVGFDFTNTWNIDGSTNNGYPFLRSVTPTGYVEWSGATSEAWDVASNWQSSDLPGTSDIAMIPTGLSNYPVITSTVTNIPKGLSIAEGASITINPGGALTVREVLLNSEGNDGLVIESDASGTGSLLHNENDVSATIKRYITGSSTLTDMRYHTVSIPLTSDNSPVSNLFLGSYLFEFDPDNQDWTGLGTSTTTPLSVNEGYLIYYPDANTTYTFAGTINNGAFSVADMTSTVDYYHLIPNPYPSAIDWDASSGWTKTNLYDAIWIFDAASGNYAAYGSEAGTNGASQFIPVGQAFFVRAEVAGPALTMNNDIRVHNSQAFYKSTMQTNSLLRIATSANDYADELIVRFREGSSDIYDNNGDVAKMTGLPKAPQLYSLSSDEVALSINSFPFTNQRKEISVGFSLNANGPVTLQFSGVDSFDPQIPLYFRDELTGNTINLRTTQEYSFVHDTCNDPLRFTLVFNDAQAIDEDNTPVFVLFCQDNQLTIIMPPEFIGEAHLELININGKTLFQKSIYPGKSVFQLPDLKTGIYLCRITNNNMDYSEKIWVR